MTTGKMPRSPLSGHLSRRQFLRLAGLSSMGIALGPAAYADLPAESAQPKITFDPVPAPCGNTPFGGPYYPSEPSTLHVGTKALFDKAKLWDVGQEIVVRFLNGQDDPWVEKVQKRVQEISPTWCTYANVTFKFITCGPCHVSINFYPFYDSLGYYHGYGLFNSFVGTDALKYLKNVQTMNLLFDPSMERRLGQAFVDAEFHRLILHEFGHGLGLIHEHQRPDRPFEWDKTALWPPKPLPFAKPPRSPVGCTGWPIGLP